LVAGDIFGGFAEQHINNTGADGALAVPVKRRGQVQLAISSLAVTDVGKPVFASDGATFTLTQSTNTRVGYVVRWVSTGVGIVCFDVRIPTNRPQLRIQPAVQHPPHLRLSLLAVPMLRLTSWPSKTRSRKSHSI
jgi:hypothetical protein